MRALNRSRAFVLLLLFTYVNPLTLLILTSSQARVFLIIHVMVLAVWLWISWTRIKTSDYKGSIPEILLGSALVVGSLGSNLPGLRESSFGIVDMFIVFIGFTVAFYGIRGSKMLNFPILFFIVMIVAAQSELASDSVRNLEYTLMAGWADPVMSFFGMEVDVFNDVVRLATDSGTFTVQLDGPLRGIRGIVAYGAIAAGMLVSPVAPLRRKFLLALLAVGGTYLFTVVRLGLILVSIATLGIDTGLALQNYVGFVVLTGWIFAFKSFALPLLTRSPVPTIPVE